MSTIPEAIYAPGLQALVPEEGEAAAGLAGELNPYRTVGGTVRHRRARLAVWRRDAWRSVKRLARLGEFAGAVAVTTAVNGWWIPTGLVLAAAAILAAPLAHRLIRPRRSEVGRQEYVMTGGGRMLLIHDDGVVIEEDPEFGCSAPYLVPLVDHLRSFVFFRPRTYELLVSLRNRGYAWCRDNGLSSSETARVLPGSCAHAFLQSSEEAGSMQLLQSSNFVAGQLAAERLATGRRFAGVRAGLWSVVTGTRTVAAALTGWRAWATAPAVALAVK